MSIFEGPSETTTSIGRRCRGGDAHSRAILIARTLSQIRPPPPKGGGRKNKTQGRRAAATAAGHASASARSRPRDSSSERVRPLAHDAAPPHARRASPRLPSCTPPPRPQQRRMRSRRPHNAAGARRKPYPPRRTAHRRLKAATAGGLHLFPFRTEKLNPRAPMILRKRESRSPPPPCAPESNKLPGALFFCTRPRACKSYKSHKTYKSYSLIIMHGWDADMPRHVPTGMGRL